MKNAKYEFTGETKIELGVKLNRIRAVVAIAALEIVAGELGGWIESEKNLSVYGDAWVYDNARVSGNAWVYGNARVYGNAWVYGDARVSTRICVATRSDGHTFLVTPTNRDCAPVIIAGCRYFTFAEARAHWTRTRGGTALGDETFAILDHLERMAIGLKMHPGPRIQ